jgi:hypothetical protein
MPDAAVCEEVQPVADGPKSRGFQRRVDRLTARVYAAEGKYNAARRDLLDTVSIAWQLLSRCEKQLAPVDVAVITGGLSAIEREHGGTNGR